MFQLYRFSIILILFGTNYSMAANYHQNIVPKKITSGAAGMNFRLESGDVQAGCAARDVYALIGPEKKLMFALLLTAKALGLKVTAYVNGCDPNTGRPAVTDLILED